MSGKSEASADAPAKEDGLMFVERGRAAEVRVCVLTGWGLNCEAETTAAFAFFGARVDQVHLADFVAGRVDLGDYGILVFIGGFSFGDHVASGRIAANRLGFTRGEDIRRFVDRGGLAIGMCNGFQTMAKLGLLPALDRRPTEPLAHPSVPLVSNQRLGYRDAWVRLVPDPESPCVFTRDLPAFECPSRHGEGRLVYADGETRRRIESLHLVPLRYADEALLPTERFPENPNGSPGGAASLCDPSGRIFGVMPHPEAYLYPENHPRFLADRERGTLPAVGLGLRIFANALRAAVQRG